MNRYLYALLCISLGLLLSTVANAQAPVAGFTSNITSGCAPILVNFTDNSTNSPTSWYWDLGNGTTSTLQNPSTTYITAGSYTVSLTVTNASGTNTRTVTNYITVAASPVVAFTADSTPSCTLPRTISFTNNSVPGGSGTTTYLWDFGDGNTSTTANPSHTYTATGNYTVTLLVTNGNGCSRSLSKTNYIRIGTKPISGFSASNRFGCTPPLTTNFTSTSIGATSYYWNFGDGNSSTAQNPSHTYTTAGSFRVYHVAINSLGCTDTIGQNDFVSIGRPAASFNVASSVCAGNALSFTNTSTPSGSLTYSWDFGDATGSSAPSPSKTYTIAGTYTVRLIASNGTCYDTAYRTITVNARPSAQFTASPTSGCAVPFTTTFSNTSTGATAYAWTFGDGNTSTAISPSNTYTSLGTYNVRLIATNAAGCADTLRRNNYISIQAPTATITTGAYNGCIPATINFTANVTTSIPVSNYSWNFGDGSSAVSCATCSTQSHTYTVAGTYTVTLTYTTGTGCTYTRTTTVSVNTKPTAGFTASPVSLCPETPVAFTNTSTGAGSYVWYFGDGNTSAATNPTYTAYEHGTYTVTLVANNNGCRDTFTRSNYITVYPPRANFTVSYNCNNRRQITVTDASIGASTSYWDFGDGTTSTQNGGSITHTYASYGTYTITLGVYNSTHGCTDTLRRTVNLQPLDAYFTAGDTTLCKNTPTTFIATPSSIIVSYSWDFGSSSTSSTSNIASEFFGTGGIYTVRLIVTDVNGCRDTMTRPNYIKVGGPNVSFTGTPTTGCLPITVNFTDNSTATGGYSIANRTWNFGTGSPTSTTNTTISNTYTTAGTYSVKLVITDDNGCKDSLTRNSYVIASKPVAQFTTNDTNICIGQNLSVNNTSTGNTITSVWHWGDATTSTGANPTHAYTASGNYTIKLVVTDMYGCKDSVTKTAMIQVNKPIVAFTLSDTAANCPPLAVTMTNASSGAVSYNWTFGNNSYSSITNPSTLYTYPGIYSVKLVATSSAGCKDSLTKTVRVDGPTGTFSYSPVTGCNPLTVNFTATSNNATSYIWDMSNGFTQTTSNTSYSYTYTQSGMYVPKLILSDGASCLVPIQGLDTVKVDYIDADFSFTPNNLCNSGTVNFTDTVYNTLSALSTRSWNFGDGNTSSAHNPSHTYTAPGTYSVRLIMTNTRGCSDTITKTVTIHANPAVSGGPSQAICVGSTTPVTLGVTGASTYVWSPATGLSCSTCANPTVLPTATTTYIVTGTDTNGCTDTGKVVITVNPLPTVAAGNDVTICNGASATLSATGATSYVWTPAGTLSCSTCTSPVANPTATTKYFVTGTDVNGCTDTGAVTVNVSNLPTVSAGSNVTICAGTSTTLNATGATSYTWGPATGLSCTGCASPVASPVTTTTYTVTGSGTAGCSNTATVTVTVNPRPTVSAGSNHAICIGSSTTLNATGAASYIWAPATGLSCTSCASPVATPTTTTTYTVTGQDANGCTNTATVTVTVNPLPNVTATGGTSICAGGSTTINGNGAATYVWTPATGLSCTSCTSPVATPGGTTTYIVTGTDANGCVDTGKITVNVNTKPTVNAGTQKSICIGASTTLTATGAATYVWTPATGLSCTNCASPTANPITTTTYTVVGTAANGCTDTDQVQVIVNPLPTVNAGTDKAICAGSSTFLSANGAATYVWTPATGLSCNNCAVPAASPATTTNYILTGTDVNGCVNTDTVKVTVNPIPDIIVNSSASVVCSGDNVQLNVSGANTYQWTPILGLSCNTCSNPVATPPATITYYVVGNSNGCTDTEKVTITVRPIPNINAGPDKIICEGNSDTLTATGGVSYQWAPASSLSCGNCATTVASPLTTTTYTVTGTDGDGCKATDNVTVTVNPSPDINAGEDKKLCSGSSVQLTATGGVSYVWKPGTSLSCTNCPDPTANPTATITYTVIGSDAIGCSDSDEVTITVIDKEALVIGPGDSICKGESTVLSASGASSYLWIPSAGLSDPTSPNPTATPEATTTYRLVAKQGDCFTDTASVTVLVHDLPKVDLGPDRNISGGSTIELIAEGNEIVKYEWTPANLVSCQDCKIVSTSPNKTTVYTVLVSNEFGCVAKDEVTVYVSCDKSQVFVANTFTPNGDGVNDTFFPQGKGLSSVKSFRVYNRWGELMFSREDMPLNNPMAGWDGTYKSVQLKPDVFVYIINAFCESGEPIEMKGDISLVR